MPRTTPARATGPRHGVVRTLPVRLPGPREETVALTVLQPQSEYAALRRWCDRVVAADGRRPSPQEVLHALVGRLLADRELAADVAADLREGIAGGELADYLGW